MTQQTAAIEKKANGATAPAQRNTIRDLIEASKPKFAEVLPGHLSVDRLVRVTIACIAKTPALQQCTQQSLLNAIMQAAQLGVEPTGVLGSAYLVPYGKECTLIVGYRGLIDLARRSGQIESIEAHVVHEKDRFTCRYGLAPALEHEPHWSGDPGPVLAVYAVAKLKDGGKQIEVMTKAQVDAIKNKSKASGSGPWKDHYDEMARKTVVRRICKYLPLTPELADALETTDPEPIDITPAAPTNATDRLRAIKAADQVVEGEPAHDPQTGEIQEPPDPDAPGAEDEPLLGADGKPI